MYSAPRLLPCGDRALSVEFANAISPAANRAARAFARAVEGMAHPAVHSAVPSFRAVLVTYDPLKAGWHEIVPVLEAEARAAMAAAAEEEKNGHKLIEIPVLYGGERGPDLEEAAAYLKLSVAELIAIHTSGTYPCYFVGFAPGLPYLGGLDPRLHIPRLPSPRTSVPAGTVYIGGQQTGIYSITSPGGMRLIGHTPVRVWDAARQPPNLVSAGDRVRFRAVTAEEYERLSAGL